MSFSCIECGSTKVRQAHLRVGDLPFLLMLKYPVRCRDCKKRWYLPLVNARRLPNSPQRRNVTERT